MFHLFRKRILATGDGQGYVRVFRLGEALTSMSGQEIEVLEEMMSSGKDWFSLNAIVLKLLVVHSSVRYFLKAFKHWRKIVFWSEKLFQQASEITKCLWDFFLTNWWNAHLKRNTEEDLCCFTFCNSFQPLSKLKSCDRVSPWTIKIWKLVKGKKYNLKEPGDKWE